MPQEENKTLYVETTQLEAKQETHDNKNKNFYQIDDKKHDIAQD